VLAGCRQVGPIGREDGGPSFARMSLKLLAALAGFWVPYQELARGVGTHPLATVGRKSHGQHVALVLEPPNRFGATGKSGQVFPFWAARVGQAGHWLAVTVEQLGARASSRN